MSDAGTLDGEWLLVMDEHGSIGDVDEADPAHAREDSGVEAVDDPYTERFTIRDAEVHSEEGSTALLDLADGRASFDLQDGRKITILVHDLSADRFSATVTENDGEEEYSDSASWVRA